MRAALRLAVVAVPMGVLLSRTMAWMSSGKTNPELISRLRDHGVIQSDRVFNAMLATDRGLYSRDYPYADSPQSIGYRATISAPHMHAHALELLSDKLTEGASALDVGSGSGYLTACFARMTGPTGRVVGIEHIDELVQMSIKNVQADDPELLSSGRIKLVGDGRGKRRRGAGGKKLRPGERYIPPPQKRNPGVSFSQEHFNETSYYFEAGLRKVYPYYFDFKTYCKGRWIGKSLLDVFKNEFRAESIEYYQKAAKEGRIRLNETPVEDLSVVLRVSLISP
uniref:RNA pseudouridine synthase domain containing 2 n=1 Tax=Haplochromis burtoni TaxID=8153 RepID=A0A3Q2W7C1_HAPBU